jgi:hypothetical protein
MRIAVLYTGALRTIKGTIEFFKKNVLNANPNNTVDVFATIQNDSQTSDEEWEKWISQQLQTNLKSLTWFDKNSPKWLQLRENLLTPMQISDRWKDYLRTSGSMIEYYQMSKCYEAMEQAEAVNVCTAHIGAPLSSFTSVAAATASVAAATASVAAATASAPPSRYDYIIRCRTDTVIAKPIDFNWLGLTSADIISRLYQVRKHIELSEDQKDQKDQKENTKKIIKCFFNTMYHPDMASDEWLSRHKDFTYHSVINNEDCDLNTILHSNLLAEIENIEELADKLKQYIERGKYILVLRANIFYICKRQYFNNIATLGYSYGKYLPTNPLEEYWFNAESQFQKACLATNMSFFSYDTELEDTSLYAYNHKQYFNNDYTLNNYNFIYFLMRYMH